MPSPRLAPVSVILAMGAAAPAVADEGPLVRHVVSAAQAEAMVDAAVAEAASRRLSVSIVVVDDRGDIVAAHRMDGSNLNYFEIARRKAATSAHFRTPSKDIEAAVVGGLNGSGGFMGSMLLDNAMPRQGALPLKLGDATIGAIGVSGAKPDEDEQIAAAGLRAITKE